MNFKKLISVQYLFGGSQIGLVRSDKVFLIFGAAFVGLAVVLKIVQTLAKHPVKRRLVGKVYVLALTLGLALVVWFGARYQNVKFFGTHFVALLLCLLAGIWLAAILAYWFRKFPSEKQEWDKAQARLKYLPK